MTVKELVPQFVRGSVFALLLVSSFAVSGMHAYAASNLIPNPSFEIPSSANPALPSDWNAMKLNRAVATFAYPIAGQTGNAAKVTVTSTSGNAGWMSNPIPVLPNKQYTFTAYTQGKSSDFDFNYTMVILGNTSMLYTFAGTAPAATTWKKFSKTFTTPSNATAITIYNYIRGAGTVSSDDFVLVEGDGTTPPGPDLVPPTVSLTAPAASQSIAGTFNLAGTATDASGIAGVKFYVDGILVGTEDTTAAYGAAFNSLAVANGAHSALAVARDTAGNVATSSSVAFTVNNPDVIAPTIELLTPTAGQVATSTINLTATSSDASGVAGVKFYVDNVFVGIEDTTAPYAAVLNTLSLTNGTHSVIAASRDTFGNRATSTAVSITVANPDAVAPTVSILTPTAGFVASSTLNLTATSSDAGGVAGVKFYVDGILVGAEDTTAPYAAALDTKTLPNGAHAVLAVSRDTTGNVATSSPISFTINNPTSATITVTTTVTNDNGGVKTVADFGLLLNGLPITSGVATTTTAGTFVVTETNGAGYAQTFTGACAPAGSMTVVLGDVKTCTLNNNDIDATAPVVVLTNPVEATTTKGTIQLSGTATDTTAVLGVKFYVDGTLVGVEDTTAPYAVSFNTTSVLDGAHTAVAVGRDSLGNVGTSTLVNFLVNNADVTPPTVSILTPTAGQVASSTLQLTATSSDASGVAGVKFYVDNVLVGTEDTAAPYAAAFLTTTVADGAHSVIAVARDTKGNVATSTARSFNVNNADVVAPAVALLTPTAGATATSTIQLTATSSDASGISGVKFYVDNVLVGTEDTTAPYAVDLNTLTLTNASHTWIASARDNAGNRATTTSRTFTVANPGKPVLTVTVTVTNDNGGTKGVSDFPISLNGLPITSGVATTTAVGTSTVTMTTQAGYTVTWSGACDTNGEVLLALGDSKTCTINNNDIAPLPTGNLILNPSLETVSPTSAADPDHWLRGGWGTNTAVFKYPIANADNGAKAMELELTAYTDGDAKWYFEPVTGVAGKRLRFTDRFQANIPSSITIQYQLTDGTFSYIGVADVPSIPGSIWTTYETDIDVPTNVANMTIFHAITQVGWLRTDSFSLTELPPSSFSQAMVSFAFDDGFSSHYTSTRNILNAAGVKGSFYVSTAFTNVEDGYMTSAQVLGLQADGHEVAAHTRTHPHLPTLTAQQATDEIVGSKNDLLAMGITNVDTFTYPFGEYNDSVKQIVKNAGFIGARSVNSGYNTPTQDKYALLDQHIEFDTTLATLKANVDQAIAEKKWLIFEAHEQQANCGTEQYCNNPQLLTDIIAYVKSKSVPIITLRQGLQQMP